MHTPPLFLGLMSGTSCDGIDAAIVRFDSRPEVVHFDSLPLPERLKEPALRLAEPGLDEIDALGELHQALGCAFADAALEAIAAAGLKPSDIAAIGSHGQTIRHRPNARHPFSLQIGSAAVIAEKTGITTVSDFRSRDIAAGGQGAPLVPFAHHMLFAGNGSNIAVLNIGGIANLTWLGADGHVLGFDTGPGNMIMDALMLTLSDGRDAFDRDGELAASGAVNERLLDELMHHPFLKRRPPKSTGREEFGARVADTILACQGLSDADRMATAAAFTARSIAAAQTFLPAAPDRWIVCGGGSRNAYLMRLLGESLAPGEVVSSDALGIDADAVEAISFAILARQTLLGLANTIPEVTGARHAVCGGQITPGRNWSELLERIPQWTR